MTDSPASLSWLMASIETPPTPRISPPELVRRVAAGRRLVMVTAYDVVSAQVAEAAEVDLVLAGDTAAMTVLGYPSTTPVSLEEMLMLTRSVRRGLTTPMLIGDLPYGSYEASDILAISSAQRLVKEAGCDGVKLEGGGASAGRARAIVRSGIPVMGHIGLTPQTAFAVGGFRTQGRTADRAAEIFSEARSLEAAGCFAIVIEAIPSQVMAELSPRLEALTIGIGAGPSTDGQVLVYNDLLRIFDGQVGRFVKRYASLRDEMVTGVRKFADEVRRGSFPAPEHCYSIDETELERLREIM